MNKRRGCGGIPHGVVDVDVEVLVGVDVDVELVEVDVDVEVVEEVDVEVLAVAVCFLQVGLLQLKQEGVLAQEPDPLW